MTMVGAGGREEGRKVGEVKEDGGRGRQGREQCLEGEEGKKGGKLAGS